MSAQTETEVDPREELLALLDGDLKVYAETCLVIKTKQAAVVPLLFNLSQRIVNEALDAQKLSTGRVRGIVLKARQMGISTGIGARFFHQAHLHSNQQALIVADLKKRSETLWLISKRFADELPAPLRWKQERTRNLQNLVLESGSSIKVETAEDTQAGRSMTIQLLHVSEMAFFANPAEVWTSLAQAVPADGTEIIIESTPNGVGNFFHRFWEEAEEGRSSWAPIFLPWWIHSEYTVSPTTDEQSDIESSPTPWERQALGAGISWEGRSWKLIAALPDVSSGATWTGEAWALSFGQIAWRRRMIRDQFLGDERSFRQEYPADPEEAFLASGNQFLEEELLERLRKQAMTPLRRGNLIRVNAGLVFRSGEQGYLRVWEEPSLAHHYVIGADTASGRLVGPTEDVASEQGGRDFSCAEVIRLSFSKDGTWHPAKVVAELHGRMVPEVFSGMLWDLGLWYSCPRPGSRTLRYPALIGVERNHSSGETVLRSLDDAGYPELYVHRLMAKTVGRPTRMLGWSTDIVTRQPMLDEFSGALRAMELECHSADLVRELRTFVRGEDGKPQAQAGTHDDRVMATAIANQMQRWHVNHGSAAPEVEFVPGKGPARW